MGSQSGAGWADRNRNFHRVVLQDTIRDYYCGFIAETKTEGIILYTNKGPFVQDKRTGRWDLIQWDPLQFHQTWITEVLNYDEDKVLLSNDTLVALLDYSTRKIRFKKSGKGFQSVCRVNNNNIAISYGSGLVEVIDIRTGATLKQLDLSTEMAGKKVITPWSEIRYGAGNTILVATAYFGFCIIDKDYRITRPVQSANNPNSIASEQVLRVIADQEGYVVLGTFRYGVSIFNILKKKAGYQRFFADRNRAIYQGPIGEMVMEKSGAVLLCAHDRLIRWNRATNTAEFFQFRKNQAAANMLYPEIYRVCVDRQDQVWVSILGWGVALLDRKTGRFELMQKEYPGPGMEEHYVFRIISASDGKIWVASNTGIYTIDPLTKKTSKFTNHPVLKNVSSFITHNLIEDRQQRIWFSTRNHGLYCYDRVKNEVKRYSVQEGLSDSTCYELFTDSRNNLYVTMKEGFQVIRPGGKIETITRREGLKYEGVNSIMEDQDGKIWIGNVKNLLRWDPATRKMDVFGEYDNFHNGFRSNSVLKTPEGELLWGTQIGINYFHPRQLSAEPEALAVSVYKVLAGDTSFYNAGDSGLVPIPYKNNDLQFDFAGINLSGSRNIRYQYRLEGYETNWEEGTDIRQARYSSLAPGHYRFRVRASINGKDWAEARSPFAFRIIPPFYMRTWFLMAAGLGLGMALLFILRRRNRLYRQKKEELDAEQAINYFSTSMYEQYTTEDILWDVARNCIGRLEFEDCVIYLLDEKNNVLVQKAAYGPKSPRSFEISQPITIPVGKGIVGAVANSLKAEIIADTRKDHRYITDDAVRLSEITVPIVSGGRLIGVIDCEHSKKGFFTQKHLSILSTIASLCASKIVRARAETEKKEAEQMLAETKQKMAEAEMQALRAQMNPHFIFNCLNSINRYIVKSDQATASLYLTRFAKLIRLILDNSHSKHVLLSNEIEALRLYIEMESLRFDHQFTYEIRVDPDVPADSLEVPPLIIQPYIENAIWHGLLHKPVAGHLRVHISLPAPDMLRCIIEDNGVGREKAAELKSKTVITKKSLGMELTENRLLLLNQYASVHSSVVIEDMKDERAESAGTKVILNIPVGDL